MGEGGREGGREEGGRQKEGREGRETGGGGGEEREQGGRFRERSVRVRPHARINRLLPSQGFRVIHVQ